MPDIKDFRLPDLGEGLEDGEIVEWHVAVGDVIDLNQAVASVETAKAIVEIPSPFAGTVVEKVGEVGETLEVGTVFLRIDVDVEGGAVAPEAVDEPAAVGESSPAQGGFETGTADADAAVPDADAEPTDAIASERRPSSALDAEDEPQPLVGYGQGKAGARRRRRRGGAADAGPEEAADGVSPDAPADAPTDAPADAPADVPADGAPGPPDKPLAKPPVRKLAKDLGVDLASLAPGSGPDGTITRDDVHAAAATVPTAAGDDRGPEAEPVPTGATAQAAAAGAPAAGERSGSVQGFRGRRPGEVEQVRGIRKRIVEKMETSRRDIPDASCSRDADLTELWDLRRTLTEQAHDEGYEVKITPFALVMRATVIALRRFPTLNARFDGDAGEIHLLEHINLGFAADTDRGLMVPNIKDAHTRSLVELAQELDGLASAARDGSIGPGSLTGGTFTVNNYGAFGNDDGDPIINHPEAGILGVGAIRERPWVVDGELAVRRVARFTLAFDHRVCDGGEAGRFVTYVADLCEQPSRLLLHA